MKLKYLVSVALAAITTISTSALADDAGIYIRGNVGYGAHTDADFDSGLILGDVESEGGPGASIGLGYDFGNNWRVELDGDTLWTDMGAISQTGNSFAKLRTNTLMLNAIYDFSDFGRWEPFVGAGIGLVQGDVSAQVHGSSPLSSPNAACFPLTNGGSGSCTIDDKDSALGYQLLAGLGYKITDNLTWDTHYTYMDVDSGGLDFDTNFLPVGDLAPFNHLGELNGAGAHTLMTGFRYRFGATPKAAPPPPPPPPPAPEPTYYSCWDGSQVLDLSTCPAKPEPVTTYTCWDQSIVSDQAQCPVPPPPPPTYTCWDGTIVYDTAQCAPQQLSYNNCGANNVAIFNVPLGTTPKQMSRLGTMPEFGDSHGLTPTQFYEKLQNRYSTSAVDKAYLNYLFKSMGYSNGFADANASMFSEEVLPVGTTGMLGLGKQHHYKYSVLPSNDRDRQAFRIQSANGSVVHFMKTCGNYMYACN